jgi:ATP-dependent HslUV protease ATP-binding subunit HslU
LAHPLFPQVLERVLQDVSFSAPERVAEARKGGAAAEGQKLVVEYVVDEGQVDMCMAEVLRKQDLSRYVL